MSEISRQEQNDPIAEPDVLKLEHLAEGIRPITACVGTYKEFKEGIEEIGDDIEELIDIETTGLDVDFFGDLDTLESENFRNSDFKTYVISPVDERPKSTIETRNCTSVTAVGREKGTGKEISILTHQDPSKFHNRYREPFVRDLKERLEELKNRCDEGTIDIAIAGGWFAEKDGKEDITEYQKSLEIINSVVKEIFGFEAVVICGPKGYDKDDIYFDTANRRLYVVRPERAPKYSDPFKPSQVGKIKKRWKSK